MNSPDRKIRCVLVHDHILLRQGLRRLLEDEPDIEVVSEASTAAEALQRVFEYRPEVLLSGASIFGLSPHETERLVRRESPLTKILFLSMRQGEDVSLQDPRAGAECALRETSVLELIEMVRRTHSDGRADIHEMPSKGLDSWGPTDALSPRKSVLTAREREVLKLLAEGRTVRSAAEILGLSIKTVDAHKFNLMRKLGIHNKAELVMWAIQKRVVKIPANF